MCLRQSSFSVDLRLDADNQLVKHLRRQVPGCDGRERVHIHRLLCFERELNVLGRLPETTIRLRAEADELGGVLERERPGQLSGDSLKGGALELRRGMAARGHEHMFARPRPLED
jgi:hypothetical protein